MHCAVRESLGVTRFLEGGKPPDPQPNSRIVPPSRLRHRRQAHYHRAEIRVNPQECGSLSAWLPGVTVLSMRAVSAAVRAER